MWKRYILPSAALLALAIFPAMLSASAEPFPNLEKGANYDREYLGIDPQGNPTYSWTLAPQRILVSGEYRDYRLAETDSTVTLETGNAGSLVFNKNNCSYDLHSAGFIDELNPPKVKGISWTVKGKSATSSTWTAVNTINSAACTVTVTSTDSTVTLVGEKSAASGTFQIVLDYSPGNGIKETFRAYNNNPAWTNHNIGFTETFEVPRIIHFGNNVYDLSQYNNTVLGRNWIENNDAKLVKLSDKIFYDFGIGFDNLNDIKITYIDGKARLSLNYLYPTQTVPYQTWFEVDPTFNELADSQGRVYSSGAGADCSALTGTNADATMQFAKQSGATGCQVIWQEWDISAVPSGATVLSAYMEFDISATANWVQECQLYAYATQPSTLSTANKWTQGWGGTDSGSANVCTTTGNDKQIPLDATGLANLQANIAGSEGWWGAMIQGTTPAADATNRQVNIVAAQTRLNIVYTVPLNPPTNFSAESQARKVQFDWDAAAASGGGPNGVTTYWIGRSLDNSTWPEANKTSTGNVTAYLSTAYWRINQPYYVNVTADNGLNSTAAYSSFTMDNYPSAPLNLDTAVINSTAVLLDWDAPASTGGDAITGYRVEASLGVSCTSFSVLTNSTAALNYTHAGLAAGQQYCYRVAAWNGVGMSAYSDTAYRLQLPDAVTDLTIISVFQTTAEISWTQPNLNGATLYSYIVYYTSPWGTPSTILESNATDTEYSILGLTPNTQYSFLVAVNTTLGVNASGNIVNISTPSDFTPGDIDFDTEIIPSLPIRFIRDDVNSTFTELDVIYDNDYDMDCVMFFRFAQDNQTFTSLAGTAYNDNEDVFTFQFNNPENEIIDIRCYDTISNRTANFQMIQSSFPFLDLITDFRNGTYGTYGQFGAIDMITLLVVIIGMVGFNRINPSVGAIFFVAILGATAAFQIIQWYTALTAGLALVVMLIIGSTTKQD